MRAFVYGFLALVALAFSSAPGAAQSADKWPEKPVRIINPFPAGSGLDLVLRIITDALAKNGATYVVENRIGAGGLVAVNAAKSSPADGYTFVVVNDDIEFIVPFLHKEPPYDPVKDLVYVGNIMQSASIILAVSAKSSIQNFQDYVAFTKSKPGSFFGASTGSTMHLGFESLKKRLDLQTAHAPYRGVNDAMVAVVQNETTVTAGSQALQFVKDGTLRAIAVNGTKRSPALPDVPTLAELGVGADIFPSPAGGLAARAGTPQPIIQKFSAELKKVLDDPEVRAAITKLNINPVWSSPEDLTQHVSVSAKLYQPLIKELGLNTQ